MLPTAISCFGEILYDPNWKTSHFKRPVLTWSQLGVFSHLMFKQIRRERELNNEKQKNILCESNLFQKQKP